ncbi:MAG: hypothetical protein IKU52_08260 [Clostridia bacterium]|nr:hypothetical protein [Clostridia bacterium]
MDSNNISSLLSGVMSNPDMMNKIQGILSNPEAMQTISKAAQGLSTQHEPENMDNNGEKEINMPVIKHNTDAENRAALICALKPYLSKERRDKADKLLSLLSLLSVSGALGNLK